MIQRLRQFLKQVMCKHDRLPQFEANRLALKCVSCGHETPGWNLNEPRPVPRKK